MRAFTDYQEEMSIGAVLKSMLEKTMTSCATSMLCYAHCHVGIVQQKRRPTFASDAFRPLQRRVNKKKRSQLLIINLLLRPMQLA